MFLRGKFSFNLVLDYHRRCFRDIWINGILPCVDWWGKAHEGWEHILFSIFNIGQALIRVECSFSFWISREVGKGPKSNNRNPLLDWGGDLGGNVKNVEPAPPRKLAHLITFFEKRVVYLEEDASWLLSISVELKTRQNWMRTQQENPLWPEAECSCKGD